MQKQLSISLGNCSKAGRKEINQDFHGALIPSGPALALKGISVLIADGISSSKVSQIAAESMVKSFLTDYYSTLETWGVKTSAMRVIRAANSWLFAQTQRSIHANNMDHGYVCTLSALVLKSRMAHIFHVGDSRIYRLVGDSLEPLTNDHRTVVSSAQSYLARAIGMASTLNVDYRTLPICEGDVFVLATDGVSEYSDPRVMAKTIRTHADNLDHAAKVIVQDALANSSPDNLTIQIVRIDALPDGDTAETLRFSETLPAPPLLEAGQVFEGYKVLRGLHANHRSHVYLVQDQDSGEKLALKIPALDLRENQTGLSRFMMEDWIARRVSSAHVLKPVRPKYPPKFIYSLTEYIKGQTLAQWMIDNPKCDLETMRGIIEQITVGLRAMHRKEMLHQDLRPENIMIDPSGTVKIIDFGAVCVAGVSEGAAAAPVPGTLQYTAPEYFLQAQVSRQSDFFSLGVIAYQMLTGRLPYGTQVAKLDKPGQLGKLAYKTASLGVNPVPGWIDGALKKILHPNPHERYETLSEFIADLRRPNPRFESNQSLPLIEKNPVGFWKGVSAILALGIVALLIRSF